MSSIALILAGIIAGSTTLVGLCIVCIPLAASFLVGLAAILVGRTPQRPRRHRVRGYTSAKLQ